MCVLVCVFVCVVFFPFFVGFLSRGFSAACVVVLPRFHSNLILLSLSSRLQQFLFSAGAYVFVFAPMLVYGSNFLLCLLACFASGLIGGFYGPEPPVLAGLSGGICFSSHLTLSYGILSLTSGFLMYTSCNGGCHAFSLRPLAFFLPISVSGCCSLAFSCMLNIWLRPLTLNLFSNFHFHF